MKRRCDHKPEFKLKIWKVVGKEYFVDANELKAAIEGSKHPIEVIKKRMGVGHIHLDEALSVLPLNVWAAKHIEWGIDFQTCTSIPMTG